MNNLSNAILEAHTRLAPYVRETPLDYSLAFSQITGAKVWFKSENLQHTGSFKVRGAMNKLLSLSPEQLRAGVVTASSGNHGAGVAFGLSKLGATGIVFVPEGASPTKLEAIRRYGAEVQIFGTTGDDTELFARQYAEQNSMVYISPYNDLEVIAGQGTIGVEIANQTNGSVGATGRSPLQPDAVFVTVGGGGLISGIASWLKTPLASPLLGGTKKKEFKIIGCQPENDAAMWASVKAGKIVEIEAKPTISDGSAGGLEPGSITFELCRDLVDEWITVSEEEIRAAMRLFMQNQYQLLEGAAGVAVASMLKMAPQYPGQNLISVICGGKIGLQTLHEILQ